MTDSDSSSNNVANDSKSAPALAKSPAKPRSSGFQWFLFLLIVLTMGATAFLAWQMQLLSRQSLSVQRFDTVQQQQLATNQSLVDVLEHASEELASSQEQLANMQTELDMLKRRIAGISGVNRVDWLIDEVEHLTRLAHQRLLLTHDAQGAMALLKAADQVVLEMRQTETLPIRQAIADDLLNLRLAADVDLEGAYIRLNSLGKKIQELNLRQPDYPEQGAVSAEADSELTIPYENEGLEQQMGGAVTHILEKLQPYLFRSFRIDTDVKPLLNADEREYLSRNMLLAVEQAQLALLRREAQSYQLSLEQSEQWVRQYYDNSDPMTVSVLNIIAELKSYQLNPEMPDIDATLAAVRHFSEKWQAEKVKGQQLKRSLSQ